MGEKVGNSSSGYVLTVVIMALALAGILIGAALLRQSSQSRIIYDTQVRTKDYYEAEAGIHHTLAWFRINSQKLAWPYRKENFYSLLSKVNPAPGDNDTTIFTVPSEVRVNPTNYSAILTSEDGLGSPQFPFTADITTNVSFDAINSFKAADVGTAKVRVSLIETVPIDPSKDYGPPPNPIPETDFTPVYRVDSMTELNEGSHVYAHITGKLVHRFDVGIYGQDYLEIRQQCDSYKSSAGQYTTARRRANCPAGSNSTAAVQKNEEIYGTLKTNGSITATPPYGGQTCADFASGCPNKGETCTGQDCGVPLLDQYYAWEVYCPQSQGNVTVAANTTWTIANNVPAERCWDTVTVNAGTVLTLATTGIPYYIKELKLVNNSNSVLNIASNPADKPIELYVLKVTGDKFNGNQVFNGNGRPRNFIFNYLGASPLVLDGTAKMNVALVSPNAQVTVSGSFEYSGALLAKRLVLQGSAAIHYDEDLGGTGPVVDVQYRIKDWVQYYR